MHRLSGNTRVSRRSCGRLLPDRHPRRRTSSVLVGLILLLFAQLACAWPELTPDQPTSRRWDFEDGNLSGWTLLPYGATNPHAFQSQPTYGDNVASWRPVGLWNSTRDKAVNLLAANIGGDFWQVGYPVGHRGKYWIGTYENRPNVYAPWGRVQGDWPTGRLVSDSFTIDRNYLTFLIGGGCQGVGLRVELLNPANGVWYVPRVYEYWNWSGEWKDAIATPICGQFGEQMFRLSWWIGYDEAGYSMIGKTARIVIYDDAQGGWGHVNVDDIAVTDTFPGWFDQLQPSEIKTVWGWADTHAHPFNGETFRSSGGGRIIHGSVGTASSYGFAGTPAGSVDMPSCPNPNHGSDTLLSAHLPGILEGQRLGGLPKWENGVQGAPDHTEFHVTDGWPTYKGWPHWFSASHQQMHRDWIRRAFDGGQRLMVATVGNQEALGVAMGKDRREPYLTDYGAIRRFRGLVDQFVAANSDWVEVALSPAHARAVIDSGKLAILLGVEVDNIGDNCNGDFRDSDGARDFAAAVSLGDNFLQNVWEQRRDAGARQDCSTPEQWERRVANLYDLGYRVLLPVHLADNGLGGNAVYGSELFNTNNRFQNGNFWSLALDATLTFRQPVKQMTEVWCSWSGCSNTVLGAGTGVLLVFDPTQDTAAMQETSVTGYGVAPGVAGGHVNTRALTPQGVAFIQAMMKRGMIVDLTHMSDKLKNRVLGLDGQAALVADPDCTDLDYFSCATKAYPVIAGHPGLRTMQMEKTEGGLSDAQLNRVLRVGGTVGPGTAGLGETVTYFGSGVGNSCSGSSRSYAQAFTYAYALGGGDGMTMSTDFNGLDGQSNPRFGYMGCFERGNQWKMLVENPANRGNNDFLLKRQQKVGDFFGGNTQIWFDAQGGAHYTYLNNRTDQVPDIHGELAMAAGQRKQERDASSALNYDYYGGAVPTQFKSTFPVRRWEDNRLVEGDSEQAITRLASHPPLKKSQTGSRVFDLNVDGLAHYGMLPDYLQDLKVVGMGADQMGAMFRGAEALIRSWEKACKSTKVDPTLAWQGC